jgi:transcriptional regulator GlxA family with amidase domain
MPKRVLIVAFEGVQSLDVTGPLEVFAHAAREPGGPHYQVVAMSSVGGRIRTSSGLDIETAKLRRRERAHTLIVAGGNEDGVRRATEDSRLMDCLKRAAPDARRVASVCTGAFVLAQTGLLNGHKVATHWSLGSRLAELHPSLTVDINAIFVESGKYWTSAGVTAGIDMALAMVERDMSREVANRIARELVLPARRLGFQSQFTNVLLAQHKKASPLADTFEWASAHLNQLDVPAFAAHAGMSVRNFHRLCVASAGTTPGKLIEQLRADRARALLSSTDLGLKGIASECGFRDASELTRAFTRRFGLAPTHYRRTQS